MSGNGLQVIILGAGEGTRLRPLTIGRPKTLAPIGNVTVLARTLEALSAAGLRNATVTVPPVTDDIHQEISRQSPAGFALTLFLPTKPWAGTVPQVRDLLDREASAVLVIYGDSFLSIDFRVLLDAHASVAADGKTMATILAHSPADLRVPETDERTYHGVMRVNGPRITYFVEKPRIEDIPADGVANAAVFICEQRLFSHPRFAGAKDFSYNVFQAGVGESMPGFHACDIGSGFRYDIGTIGRLVKANQRVLRDLDRSVLIGRDAHIADDAQLGPNTVIGHNCVINEGAVVSRSIVMDRCRIGARTVIEDCVLGPNCRVGPDERLPPFTVMGSYSVAGERWMI